MTNVREIAERIALACPHGDSGYGRDACVDCIAAALADAERRAHETAATEWQEGYERERVGRQRAEAEVARLRTVGTRLADHHDREDCNYRGGTKQDCPVTAEWHDALRGEEVP